MHMYARVSVEAASTSTSGEKEECSSSSGSVEEEWRRSGERAN